MSRSKLLGDVHGTFLSELPPEFDLIVRKRLSEIEDRRGHCATAGGFFGQNRQTLVLHSLDWETIYGAVVIHQISAVDFLFDNENPKMFDVLADYAHARAEGFIHGRGGKEYIAIVPDSFPDSWHKRVKERFGGGETFTVYRRRV